VKILAIPRNNEKNYSFELFELLRCYQNEITTLIRENQIPEVKFLSMLHRLKNPFIVENELITQKLEKIMAKNQFHFMWNLGLNKEYLPYITQKARQKDIKLIQTISDDSILVDKKNPTQKILDKIIKFYAPDVDLFIAHSKFAEKLLLQNGILDEKIVHIPLFIDTQKYTPHYKSENYFVYQHTSENTCNIKALIKIMRQIPQHKLIIIENENTGIKPLIQQNNLPNILFLDNLNNAQQQNILKLARFNLIISDTKPQKILESYALGKPVLAIKSGSNPEYIVDKYSGLLSENYKNEILEKIDYLMKNENFCRDAGTFARSLAENCFDKQSHYNRIFKAFHSIKSRSPLKINKSELLNIS